MATKSILKNIVIKDRRGLRNLVRALEYAAEKHAVELPPLNKPTKDLKAEELDVLFIDNGKCL